MKYQPTKQEFEQLGFTYYEDVYLKENSTEPDPSKSHDWGWRKDFGTVNLISDCTFDFTLSDSEIDGIEIKVDSFYKLHNFVSILEKINT